MRLRTLILALIALGGIWIALVIQRGHDAPAASFAAGPQPADFAPPQLVQVKGLNRPVAATPVANVSPRVKPFTRVPTKQTPDVQILADPPKPEPHVQTTKAPAIEVVPEKGRSYTETATPPLEALAISDAHVVSVTSSSARIIWKTNLPAQTKAAFGFDAPTIWSQPSADFLTEHESVLTGLEFSTTYQVYLHGVDEWNRAQTSMVSITTQSMGSRSIATTNGGQIVVDDRPFFPTAVWAQCSDGFGSNIDDGINLFMGDGCSKDDADLSSRLDGRAYSIVNAANAAAEGQGVIGWYYPDEWDAFLQSTVRRQELDRNIPPPQSGRISFLTLTNHFYSLASPLPQGKGMYPLLMSITDVVGFDLYPLQVWCRPAFGDVMDAQRELHTTSGGKPTFQWIEAAPMEQECRKQKYLDPTPATVRAETWLAIAGGAAAIGYFPNHWSASIGSEIARTNREIKALSQALLAPAANATSDSPSVRVSARNLNGATYVIAVNTTESTLQAKFTVEGIGGRSPVIVGGGQVVGADDQGFTDSFGPLAARVYIIPPAGW
ncbi:MAG: hypothetical protein H0W90_01710 [Actinobacteria bacterium]|nr:hypothetical protein [Actinomycetota bacterium]